ncbi:MAG TPA: hypothetical protein VF153_06085 [Candidatus Limnocylindria bacterium]
MMDWRRFLPRALGGSGTDDEITPGTTIGESVPMERLICPLRYDIHVRVSFVELLRDEWPTFKADRPAFLELPAARAYRTWHDEVLAKRRAALREQRHDIDESFAARVDRTGRLWESFRDGGFDASQPVELRSGRVLQLPNGKAIGTRIFAGDGCHRLACLIAAGQTELLPAQYYLRTKPEFAPRDNTALLLRPLGLDLSAYLAFLSPLYADGATPATVGDLRVATATRHPDLAAELESVLAHDLPLVNASQ